MNMPYSRQNKARNAVFHKHSQSPSAYDVSTEIWQEEREETLRETRRVTDSSDEEGEEEEESPSIDALEDLVAKARSDNCDVQLNAVRMIRKLLSSRRNSDPLVDALIQCGILPILVHCLERPESPSLQFEAVWALTNMSSGTSAQTQAVVGAGAVPLFLQLLLSHDHDVREQAAWALCNVIGDGPQLRDYAIRLGVIQRLCKFIVPDARISLLRIVARLLGNLCRFQTYLLSDYTIGELLRAINKLIDSADINLEMINAVLAIGYLAEGGNHSIQIVIESGVVCKLIPLLAHKEAQIQSAALRALGTISMGTNEQTQYVLDGDVLLFFHGLLNHREGIVCKETIWFLSNITAGSQEQVQEVINANLLPKVIQYLSKEEYGIQLEAVWVVSNITFSGNPEQVSRMIHEGVIRPFGNLLKCVDIQTLVLVLGGINNMLKMAGRQVDQLVDMIQDYSLLPRIKLLSLHKNPTIASIANTIYTQCCRLEIDSGNSSCSSNDSKSDVG